MATTEENKKLVLEFHDITFNKKDVAAGVEYLADNYKQHNPHMPDGKQGYLDGIGGYLLKGNPNLKLTIKRVIADGDFVVLHVFGKFDDTNEAEIGTALIDIFRVENGKIAEHWDVIQAIPDKPANENTMF